jgi:hypothetical protein
MAYKFQLGQARLSGSVIQEGDVTAESSQLNASTIDLTDASGIAGDGMEDQSGNLGIAAGGVTNSMLSGGISSAKIAELNDFSTSDLSEGSNLYYTEARWDSKMAAADTGDLAEGSNLYWTTARGETMFDNKLAAADTGDLAEGSNLYYTDARVHAAVSVADSNSIDMSYDGSGQFSADAIVDGSSLEIDAVQGIRVKALGITNAMLSGAIASSKIAELNAFDTGDLAEGSNLYYTQARFDSALAAKDTGDLAEGSNLYYTDARVHAALSVADSTSIDMSYDSAGEFSAVIQPLGVTNAMLSGAIASSKIAELNDFSTSDLAEGSNLYYTEARWDSKMAAADTDDLAEGAANLYFTEARSRASVSVSDSNSVDMSYASGTGIFSADVLVDADALEVTANGVALKSTIAGSRTFSGDVEIQGGLNVQGSLTYIETTNLAISDALITVGSGSSAFANNYGVEFGDVDGGWASMKTAEVDTGVNGFEFSHPIKASRFYGEVVGAMVESIQTLSAGAAIDSDNGTQILLDHATEQTFTLPAASQMEGLVLKIKRIGSGESVIEPAGAEELEGAGQIRLESQGAAVSIISDGSNYFVI